MGARAANVMPPRAVVVNGPLAPRPSSKNLSRTPASELVKSFVAYRLCSDRVGAQMRQCFAHLRPRASLGRGASPTACPAGGAAGRGMIEWRPNQSDAATSGRNRAAGSALCERHASVICCTAGAMGKASPKPERRRRATGRRVRGRRPTVSRVIFAEAATRSSRGQPVADAELRTHLRPVRCKLISRELCT